MIVLILLIVAFVLFLLAGLWDTITSTAEPAGLGPGVLGAGRDLEPRRVASLREVSRC